MIARLWETRIDPMRGEVYDTFANTYSRPMFASLPGCIGAFFLGTGEIRSVLSLWLDNAAIDALHESNIYGETVAMFQATGVLREPQSIKLFEITGGTINALALTAELQNRVTA